MNSKLQNGEASNLTENARRYVQNEMTAREREQFEKKIAAEEAVAREVDYFQKAMLLMRRYKEDLERERIGERVRTQLEKGKTPVYVRPKFWGAIAASLIGLLFLIGLWFANTNYSNEKLAAGYYLPPNSSNVAGDQNTDEENYYAGLEAYYKKDYLRAIIHFSKISATFSDFYSSQNFLSHCYFETGEYKKSLAIIREFLEKNVIPPFSQRERLEWNAILNYLAMGEHEKVEELLESLLTDKNHRLHNSAKELQKELNSPWRKLVW